MERKGYRDVSLEVPVGWQDDTLLRFVGPRPPGVTSQPEITVALRPLAAGETVDVVADRELMKLAREWRSFKLEESRSIEFDGRRAIEQRFTWEGWERKQAPAQAKADVAGGGGIVAQRQIFVAVDATAYVITVTCSHEQAARTMPFVERILGTIRLGQAERPAERLG